MLILIPLTSCGIGFIGVFISYGNAEPKVIGVMLCVAPITRGSELPGVRTVHGAYCLLITTGWE